MDDTLLILTGLCMLGMGISIAVLYGIVYKNKYAIQELKEEMHNSEVMSLTHTNISMKLAFGAIQNISDKVERLEQLHSEHAEHSMVSREN